MSKLENGIQQCTLLIDTKISEEKLRNFYSKTFIKNLIPIPSPNYSGLRFFSRYRTTLMWCAILSSNTVPKVRNFSWPISKKIPPKPNFRHLIHLNPHIKILLEIPFLSLFLLYWPPTSWKNSEKLMSSL